MAQRPLLNAAEESRARRFAQQPKSARSLVTLLAEVQARTIKAALAAKQVAERLENTRHAVIGADLPALGGAPSPKRAPGDEKEALGLAEVGVYDYDRNVLVVPFVDLRKGVVTKVEERRGFQPPLTPHEVEEAKRLVFSDARHQGLKRQAKLQVVAYPVRAAFLESHAYYGRRCFVLYFWTSGKQPRKVGRAVVDLSTQQLVREDAVQTPFAQGEEL